MLGVDPAIISTITTASGAIVGVPIGIFVVKWVISKKEFSDFKVVLVSR